MSEAAENKVREKFNTSPTSLTKRQEVTAVRLHSAGETDRLPGGCAQATHAGEIQIGNTRIVCAVLDGGIRVINQGTMLTALGRNSRAKGGSAGSSILAANLRPFASDTLNDVLNELIRYRTPSGTRALGYPASVLPDMCEVYLEARKNGVLLKSQERAVDAAETLVRGLARVGIIALVDEATGYQEVRARRELQKVLEAYVATEYRPWIKTFPDEFFEQIYRLQGWEYKPGTSKRSPYVGTLVNRYIYEQLPHGVLEELQKVNPRQANGRRRYKHHQRLSADTGNSHLDKQISHVIMLMRISKDRAEFEDLFARAFPEPQLRLPLVLE
ncbi:P63C domain-containing protein [Streptomyces profundus]|uniref:P63C domain-containing protein n=1 Tax=Streptomyces profundus TaxID=2867410 RepID=UPI001D16735F|nr:P63C domain-containing protein [Streptomyces sp. MA3_2.13]UED84187.1 P63C domain-containing protein [Streptomyces sp. MA3_2.13]